MLQILYADVIDFFVWQKPRADVEGQKGRVPFNWVALRGDLDTVKFESCLVLGDSLLSVDVEDSGL